MVMDFKMSFRYLFTNFFRNGCTKINAKLFNIIENERKSKIRWRKIKLSIHEIILRKRDNEKIHFEADLI